MITDILQSSSSTCMNLQSELTEADKNELQPAYEKAIALPSMSATELLASLLNDGVNSPVFDPIACYLNVVERACTVTYDDSLSSPCPSGVDSNGQSYQMTLSACKQIIYANRNVAENKKSENSYTGSMTVGIGLNLNISTTRAVVLSVNPAWDFKTMQTTANKPHPPMTENEVRQLLYYTLVGAKYNGITYVGILSQLISKLKKNSNDPNDIDLSNKQLPFNQLVSLVSLAFNAPKNIGSGLKSALNDNDELSSLIEIIERSNRDNIIGLANRRLKDGGMFHNLEDIYLPWRQYADLCMSSEQFNFPPNYLSTHALPKGNEQSTFSGNASLTVLPGRDSLHQDTITYGTNVDDIISVTNGNQVAFGGDGNDWFKTNITESTNYYYFLAGGQGYDRYDISTSNANPYRYFLIDDADTKGEIFSNGLVIQGIAGHSDSYTNWYLDFPYTLLGYQNFNLYKKDDEDIVQLWQYSSTLVKTTGKGEFGIAMAEPSKIFGNIRTEYASTVIATPDDKILLVFNQNYDNNNIVVNIYSQSGKLEQNFSIMADATYIKFASVALNKDYMTFIGVQSYSYPEYCGQKLMAYYYTSNGVFAEKFQISPPENEVNCTHTNDYYENCCSYAYTTAIPAISIKDGSTIVVYQVSDSYGKNFLYGQLLNRNPSWPSPSFLIKNMPTGVYGFDIKLASYGDTGFVASIYDHNSTISSYVYQNSGVQEFDIENTCMYPCSLVSLLPLYQQKGFFLAYTDKINEKFRTHTQVIYDVTRQTAPAILHEGSTSGYDYLSQISISSTLVNDIFFISSYSNGILINSRNEIMGDIFSTLYISPGFDAFSANSLSNGDLLLLGQDAIDNPDFQAVLSSTYVNTHSLPALPPENLSWENQAENNVLNGTISFPDASLNTQLAFISVICHSIRQLILRTFPEELHEITPAERDILIGLNQQTEQLVKKLSGQVQNKFIFSQKELDYLADSTYLLQETQEHLSLAFKQNQISANTVDKIRENILRIHGWLDKLPHSPEFGRKTASCQRLSSQNHWSSSVWSMRNTRENRIVENTGNISSLHSAQVQQPKNLRVGY